MTINRDDIDKLQKTLDYYNANPELTFPRTRMARAITMMKKDAKDLELFDQIRRALERHSFCIVRGFDTDTAIIEVIPTEMAFQLKRFIDGG